MRNAVAPLLNWHRYAVNVRFVPVWNERNGKEVIPKIGESLTEERLAAHERCTEQVTFIVIRLLPRRCVSTNVGMIPIREIK
jgi:hypothetical protein